MGKLKFIIISLEGLRKEWEDHLVVVSQIIQEKKIMWLLEGPFLDP